MMLHLSQTWMLILVYTIFHLKTSLTEDISHQDMLIKQSLQSCSIRFSMIEEVRARIPCPKVKKINPICGNNITVAFSHMPPYVHNNSEHIVGILPGNIYFVFDQSIQCFLFSSILNKKTLFKYSLQFF